MEGDIFKTTQQRYLEKKIPAAFAERVASLATMFTAFDIIQASNTFDMEVLEVAEAYFALGDRLDLGWFREKITSHPVESRWEALVREALRDDVDRQQQAMSIAVLQRGSESVQQRVDAWFTHNAELVRRWQSMLADLRSGAMINYTMFTVAVRELMDLARMGVPSMGSPEGKKEKVGLSKVSKVSSKKNRQAFPSAEDL